MPDTSAASGEQPARPNEDGSFIDTVQSLIVAFVLAMTFRGFVTEGFVIPTGSMAPTLMGRHVRLQSPVTGSEYPVGLSPSQTSLSLEELVDPMLGPGSGGSHVGTGAHTSSRPRPRMGDRILVLKTLYPFFQPKRFDVVVFKNPTNPNGENGNYIKRLVGLSDEAVWLVDGDVFAGPFDAPEDHESYRIQRKPEHVQRSVWQPVFDSDFLPPDPDALDVRFLGPAWRNWETDPADPRVMRSDGARLELVWDQGIRRLDDWTSYNQPMRQRGVPISDLRVAGAFVPHGDGLVTRLELTTRDRIIEFVIDTTSGEATIRMRPDDDTGDVIDTRVGPLELNGNGRSIDVEFWHVDQEASIFVNGKRVVSLPYDWNPIERMQRAFAMPDEGDARDLAAGRPSEPRMRWSFEGAPFDLRRVRVDRDLYYRSGRLKTSDQQNTPLITGYGFGTHPDNIAMLGPDHFMMLGDNSPASLDSRLWGQPHPLIKEQIDDAAFVVHRKLLLGKAWVVYFPSPVPFSDGGKNIVPDFGRLRFIR